MSVTAPALLSLRLFGQIRLCRADVPVHVGARKALALLALLALDGAAPRDRLAARLWSEVDAAAARRNLRREVFRLRELGCGLVEAADGAMALEDRLLIDVVQFRAALKAGDDAGALQWASDRVLEGLDGVAGPEFDAWLGRWRLQLQQERQAAHVRHAEALEQGGQADAALALHLKALAEDPCAEPAARAAMRLRAALGDRAGALALYTQLARALQEDFDLQPDAQTRALADALRQPAALSTPAPTVPPEARAPRRQPGAMLADRLPFVGRTSARAQIEAAWAAGRRVYLHGTPGAGKTRLATECLAAQGAWLRVACAQDDAEQHHASAVRALRALHAAAPDVVLPAWVRRELAALLPELGEPPVPQATPEAAERLRAAFATAWGLLVRDNFNALLLDDWQWGDAASVALWNRLDDAEAPVRWIVAFRTAELPPAALRRMRHDVDTGRAVAVGLEGLDAAEAQALVQALVQGLAGARGGPALAHHVRQATDGNPFFLIETLRHLSEQGLLDADTTTPPVPASVRETVLGRVRALGDGPRRLLEAASLTAERFDVGLLEGITHLPSDAMVAALEHAQAARLVTPSGDGYRFAHDLIRQCLAESLSPARRQVLHQALATRLEARAAAPAMVALHLEGAGRPADAVAWRVRAAESGWQLHALDDCRRQYELALADGAAGAAAVRIHLALARLHRRTADPVARALALQAALAAAHACEPDTRLEVQLETAQLYVHQERQSDALALLAAVEGDLATAPARLRARVARLRAEIAHDGGRTDEAMALRRQAIALLEGDRDALQDLAELHDEAARTTFMLLGEPVQAEALARRALAGFEAAGNLPQMARTLGFLGVTLLYGRGDRPAAEAVLQRGRALAQRCGHVPAHRAALLNLIKLHTDVGQAEMAQTLIDEGEALAPTFQHAMEEQAFAQARYFVLYLRGQLQAADAAAQQLLALARRLTDRVILAESVQMVVDLYLHTGRIDEAGALLDEAEGAVATGTGEGRPAFAAALAAKRAWWQLARGDAAGALQRVAALGPPPRDEDRWPIGWIGAAAALACGDRTAATHCLQGLDIAAEAVTDALAMVLVQRLALDPGDAAARVRAQGLLAGGCVPALEAAKLRAALG